MHSHPLRLAWFLVLAACASETEPAGPSGVDASVDEAPIDTDGPTDGPTFYGDVAPILARNCVTCHQSGGIAPFQLIEYAQVKPLAASIKTATHNRTMPPFLPDNSGACATYHDAMWLSD